MAIAGAGGTQLQRNRLASSASDREYTKRRGFVHGDVVHTQGAVIVKHWWGNAWRHGIRRRDRHHGAGNRLTWAGGITGFTRVAWILRHPNRARAIVFDGAGAHRSFAACIGSSQAKGV